jgi:cell division GTPase FtsZ
MRTPAFSAPIMADVLLHEWENRAFPAHDAAYAAARPLAVAALGALLGALVYRRPANLALDLEDVRDALRRARAFGIGCATATGPDRATRLVPAAVAACRQAHLGTPPAGTPALALLHLGSHPAAELEMDELSELTETLQATLGPDVEIIFWHHCDEALPAAAVQLWLLLGYGKP